MTRYRVLPYRQGSRGARALADALGGRVLYVQGSRFRPRSGDVVIRWGAAREGERLRGFPLVNDLDAILTAANKREFFQRMPSDVVPEFWTNAEDIPEDAYPIVARTVLNGHSGEGIVIAETPDDLVPAPLYVRYVKKQQEYRIHLGIPNYGEAQVLAVQRKARKRDVPDSDVNWQVRNLKGGFIYQRQGVTPPDSVLAVARRAFGFTGLHFGAVDVIHRERDDTALVLEVNTAPGLTGSTVEDYARYFRGLAHGL